MPRLAPLVALAVSAGLGSAATAAGSGPPAPSSSVLQVVVPAGQPMQIVVLADPGAPLGTGAANAVQMAVDAHTSIRGHNVQINVVKVTTCGSPLNASTAAANAARKVVANRQNVAVLGQICSFGFAGALPIYQNARVVAITGSATNNSLTTSARTYLDRTIVNDDLVDDWYPIVTQLPSDLAWQDTYTARFGSPPPDFADLYYDAANLLLDDVQRVSRVDARGNLIVSRAALARVVRATTGYQGVSCTITLDPATGDRLDEADALSGCAGGG